MIEKLERVVALLDLIAVELGVEHMVMVFDENDRLIGVATGEKNAINAMAQGAYDDGFDVELAVKTTLSGVH